MPSSPRRFTNGVAAAFSAGVLSITILPTLPTPVASSRALAALVVLAVLVAFKDVRLGPGRAGVHALLALAIGAVYAVTVAGRALEHRAGRCVDGIEAVVQGRIEGLPSARAPLTRFDLELTSPLTIPHCTRSPLRRLRVSWYANERIQPDETWTFRVRLRSIRAFQNPGTFDYEAQLLERRVDAAGTVRAGKRLAPAAFGFDGLRQRIADRVAAWPLEHRGILLALTTGDTREMRDVEWELFQRTGTVHVVVISGMHVSLAAVVGFVFGQGLARLFPPLIRRVPARQIGASSAVLFATLYAGLAGGGIPIQRAWLTTSVAAVALSVRHRPTLSGLYLTVLAAVLTFDPLSALAPGFWLSFGAVAVLFAAASRSSRRRSLVLRAVRVQGLMFVTMLPLGAAVLHQVPWVAMPANLAAVPTTSLIVVPLLLFGLLVDVAAQAGQVWWIAADRLTQWLLRLLELFDRLPPTVLGHLDGRVAALALAAAATWLLPLPPRARVVLTLAALPLFAKEPAVPEGEVRVTVLDVGQGLAIVVDTARHRLVYDAGPRHLSGFDLGRAVVVPAFRATGRTRLDLLVLSHRDLDHVGGAMAVAERLHPIAVLTGSPTPGFETAVRCRQGLHWQWDDVRFHVLHPTSQGTGSSNDQSCVLEVETHDDRALIPGDIEARVEAALVRRAAVRAAAIVVIPHHGSNSSSSRSWVDASRPLWAIASAGHTNRFGHPTPRTVGRYTSAGACVRSTADAGAIVWSSTAPHRTVEWRRRAPPYWRVGGSATLGASCD